MNDGTKQSGVSQTTWETENTEKSAENRCRMYSLPKTVNQTVYPCQPTSTLNARKRMLYFPMDFAELTIDGLIDTGALSSAIPENGPPENPTLISTICYPGRSASKFPNHGRKWAIRDSQESYGAQIWSW